MTYPQDPNNPYGQPGYGQQYPSGGYQQPGYPQYPGYPGGMQQPREGAGLAVGSLVCSILGLVLCVAVGIAGVIMGHIAYGKGKRGEAEGQGLAMAGIIIGYIAIALNIALVVVIIAIGAANGWR